MVKRADPARPVLAMVRQVRLANRAMLDGLTCRGSGLGTARQPASRTGSMTYWLT